MTRALLIAALCGWPGATRAASPAWEELAPLAHAVAGQAVAATADTVWIAGGSFWERDTKWIDETVRRRRRGASAWEAVATLPRGFAHGGFAADERALWLVGGLDVRGPSAAVTRIDLATGSVRDVTPLPEPRAYGGTALLDGALWVVGGTPVDGDFTRASATSLRIDLGGVATRVSRVPAAGPAWINPLVLALRGELHVLPGGVWSAERARLETPRDVWIFSPGTGQWRQRPLAAPLPRGLSGVALDTRRALVAGGVEPRDGATVFSARAWIYDAVDGTFTPQAPLPAPRLAAAAVRADGGIWFLGGEDRARSRAATIWRWPIRAATPP